MRAGALGLPEAAFVVGSFVKDGVGLGQGSEPKLFKGPDILVATVGAAAQDEPRLFVLLTGPARGFVRRELEPAGHSVPARVSRLPRRAWSGYQQVDACLVTSRQEGGPKASLEATATGVPLVSTRVGQVPELLSGRVEALFADVDDVEALVGRGQRVRDDAALAWRLRAAGTRESEMYSDERLDPTGQRLARRVCATVSG